MTVRSDWQEHHTREFKVLGEVRRIVPPAPPDPDPAVFNMETAWWGPPNAYFPSGWRATKHGCGDVKACRACGCERCVEYADRVERSSSPRAGRRRSAASPVEPIRVPARPVRERVEELVAAGWTLSEIASRAGVDASTVSRVRRSSAAQVARATANGVFAISNDLALNGATTTKDNSKCLN